MANPLERAATRRKAWYFAAIIALFTVSMFWRGKLPVPGASALRQMVERNPNTNGAVKAVAYAANHPISEQASELELRELDQGEPEIAGTAMRLALTGSRGVAITVLWKTAIEKQKRNEWTQFENAARLVTRLQPNFVTPWLFQAWNIAYNVSVENDKLGDMFFYIAHGIELLSEGDRLNSKVYRTADGVDHKLGSPDIRYNIGFFYQNKFGVSDKVNTLRSLMQLAVIPPGERDPKSLTRDNKVDPKAFREFCEKNPQLVRRLREHVFVDAEQRNPYATPELIVQFLDENYKIPGRFETTNELKKIDDRFPSLPPIYPTGQDEYNPDTPTDDTFDAFHAARAWFGYAIATTPPPKTGSDGRPLPWATPTAAEYDQFRYRMPRMPAFIIFRQQWPLSQTKLAERLAKEGWFDSSSAWNPDEHSDNLWFKKSPSDPDVVLTSKASSLKEWRTAYDMWKRHADENALVLDPASRRNLELLAARVPVDASTLLTSKEFTPERLAELKLTQDNIDAKKALLYYEQNRSMTNFPYFMATSEAEADPLTVDAQKLLFRAETNQRYGSNAAAIRDYVAGLSLWRQALVKYPNFHHPERSEANEERTFEYEMELIKLLRGDGQVLARAAATAAASASLFPALPELTREDFEQATAEREAGIRVVAQDPQVQRAISEEAHKLAEKQFPSAHHALCALAGSGGAHAPGHAPNLVNALEQALTTPDLTRRVVTEKFDWMRDFVKEPPRSANNRYLPVDSDYWVRPSSKDVVRGRLGQTRQTSAVSSEPPSSEPQPGS